jgi:hypothetical protein
MSQVSLVLGTAILPVDRLLLCQASDLFTDSTAPVRYTVRSDVSRGVLEAFVGAIQGKPLEITPATLDPLSALCREFGCPLLSDQLSDFRNSAAFGLSCLTARVSALEARLSEVMAALSARPGAAAAAAGAAAAAEAEPLARLSRPEAEAEFERVSGGCDAEIGRLRAEVSGLRASFSLPAESAIVSGFRDLFAEFGGKRFTLLWRGSRDGFGARDFHDRCDGHANTLTLIADTAGNIFGGFTPVKWESPSGPKFKSDASQKTFIFTLKNPHNLPAKKFSLKAGWKNAVIICHSSCGPCFRGIDVRDHSDANADSTTELGYYGYTNDTGVDGRSFFTGSFHFTAKEIEVFEITC